MSEENTNSNSPEQEELIPGWKDGQPIYYQTKGGKYIKKAPGAGHNFPMSFIYDVIPVTLTECSLDKDDDYSDRIPESVKELGCLMNLDGSINMNICLPFDDVLFPNKEATRALIFNAEVSEMKNGLFPLSATTDYASVLSLCADVEEVLACLWHNGIFCAEIEETPWFFNPEYGAMKYLYTGDALAEHGASSVEDADKFAAAIAVYLLTGASLFANGMPYCNSFSVSPSIDISADGTVSASGAEVQWDAVPEAIKAAIITEVTSDTPLTAQGWKELLTQTKEALQMKECSACGHSNPDGAKQCLCCGNRLNLEEAMTRWEIRSEVQGKPFYLTFGTGTVIYGSTLTPSLASKPLFKLVYSKSKNMLGVLNLGTVPIKVIYSEDTQIMVASRHVFVLKEGVSVFDPKTDKVTMTLKGIEY